ncbi:MAG: DUF4376 domain-containing protein, partial [Paracoccaceae bacterium]
RPDFVAGWPEAGMAGPGWAFDGETFLPPDIATPALTVAMVNAERDRRMSATFLFSGKRYDCDRDSTARITGAATLAGFALGAGAQPGDLRWHGGDADFVWIAADNSFTPMDAPTCFAFGQAAAANQSAHIFAARALKDMDPIPADFADDTRWPL